MNLYNETNMATITDGWYWANRYEGDTPKAVPVYWCEPKPNGYYPERYLTVDFGYCSEVHWIPGKPEASCYIDGLKLYGPINVPEF